MPHEQLRQLWRDAEVTLQELADRLSCSKGLLSLMESGQRTISLDWAHRLEGALGVEDESLIEAVQWRDTPRDVQRRVTRSEAAVEEIRKLLAGDDAAADLRKLLEQTVSNVDEPQRLSTRIPVINKVAAGYPIEFTDLDYPASIADEYIASPDMADPDAFAARVVGDSMEPEYREGEIVVFSPELPTVDGSDCFVRLEIDNETTFKRVYFENDGERIRLQPLNEKYQSRTVGREDVAGMYAASHVLRQVRQER